MLSFIDDVHAQSIIVTRLFMVSVLWFSPGVVTIVRSLSEMNGILGPLADSVDALPLNGVTL